MQAHSSHTRPRELLPSEADLQSEVEAEEILNRYLSSRDDELSGGRDNHAYDGDIHETLGLPVPESTLPNTPAMELSHADDTTTASGDYEVIDEDTADDAFVVTDTEDGDDEFWRKYKGKYREAQDGDEETLTAPSPGKQGQVTQIFAESRSIIPPNRAVLPALTVGSLPYQLLQSAPPVPQSSRPVSEVNERVSTQRLKKGKEREVESSGTQRSKPEVLASSSIPSTRGTHGFYRPHSLRHSMIPDSRPVTVHSTASHVAPLFSHSDLPPDLVRDSGRLYTGFTSLLEGPPSTAYDQTSFGGVSTSCDIHEEAESGIGTTGTPNEPQYLDDHPLFQRHSADARSLDLAEESEGSDELLYPPGEEELEEEEPEEELIPLESRSPSPVHALTTKEWVLHNERILEEYAKRQISLPLGKRLNPEWDEASQFTHGTIRLLAGKGAAGQDSSSPVTPQVLEDYVDLDRWAKEYFRSRYQMNRTGKNVSVLLSMIVNNMYEAVSQVINHIGDVAVERMEERSGSELEVEDFAFDFDLNISQQLPAFLSGYGRVGSSLEALVPRRLPASALVNQVITRSGRRSKLTPQAQAAALANVEKSIKAANRGLVAAKVNSTEQPRDILKSRPPPVATEGKQQGQPKGRRSAPTLSEIHTPATAESSAAGYERSSGIVQVTPKAIFLRTPNGQRLRHVSTIGTIAQNDKGTDSDSVCPSCGSALPNAAEKASVPPVRSSLPVLNGTSSQSSSRPTLCGPPQPPPSSAPSLPPLPSVIPEVKAYSLPNVEVGPSGLQRPVLPKPKLTIRLPPPGAAQGKSLPTAEKEGPPNEDLHQPMAIPAPSSSLPSPSVLQNAVSAVAERYGLVQEGTQPTPIISSSHGRSVGVAMRRMTRAGSSLTGTDEPGAVVPSGSGTRKRRTKKRKLGG